MDASFDARMVQKMSLNMQLGCAQGAVPPPVCAVLHRPLTQTMPLLAPHPPPLDLTMAAFCLLIFCREGQAREAFKAALKDTVIHVVLCCTMLIDPHCM
jgi:hypothetical protein